MTTSLTHQTQPPAHRKIAIRPSREKVLSLGHRKPVISRRSALLFIGGIETPANAPFFPPIPPSFRLPFDAPIVASTHSDNPPPFTPSRLIADEAATESLHPRGADNPLAKTRYRHAPLYTGEA